MSALQRQREYYDFAYSCFKRGLDNEESKNLNDAIIYYSEGLKAVEDALAIKDFNELEMFVCFFASAVFNVKMKKKKSK